MRLIISPTIATALATAILALPAEAASAHHARHYAPGRMTPMSLPDLYPDWRLWRRPVLARRAHRRPSDLGGYSQGTDPNPLFARN
jgi:hypothetical protein